MNLYFNVKTFISRELERFVYFRETCFGNNGNSTYKFITNGINVVNHYVLKNARVKEAQIKKKTMIR